MSQYFDLFQLPEQFNLDQAQLDQRYRQLAAQCHPDKFATRSAFEQKQAMMMAATVNEAYRILSQPLDRAAYLLNQHGIDADAPEHTHFASEFLMQQMAWREELEDARAQHDNNALTALADTIRTAQTELEQHLAESFHNQAFEQAAEAVRQGRFLVKLQQEITRSLG
ncbi:Fe-S protein assembly co-chaperone HscB [Neisseriaceae bacterium ESL0693]|nr:Fe-S protein assembly co-chaperone HscB [Neisseriaceae bacterium ESL0693]